MSALPPHILASRRALCRSCDCGADPTDPCSACGKGLWRVHRTCLPGLPAMAANLATAATQEAVAIARQAPPVSPEEVSQRLARCTACDRFLPVEQRCALCGCFVAFKSRLRSQNCPVGKW